MLKSLIGSLTQPRSLTWFFSVTAVFLTATANITFFRKVIALYSVDQIGILASFVVVLIGVHILLFSLLAWSGWAKGLLIAFVLIASVCSYFTDTYGTVFDKQMLINSLETNVNEASDLLSIAFILRFFLLGVLPALCIYYLPIKSLRFRQAILQRVLLLFGSLILVALPIWLFGDRYASFLREHKAVRYYTNPLTAIYSAGRLASDYYKAHTQPTELTQKAQDLSSTETDEKPELVVFIVGESARADHFALNGYGKETNPLLSQQANLFSYSQVSSCGTSTAYSVPCLFSYLTHDDFSIDKAKLLTNVVDALANGGVRVLWRDNNSSSKGVADRVLYQNYQTSETNPICDEECRDEGMLVGLDSFIKEKVQDTFIVLHQMGNHGPAYYKRYPKSFEHFTPVCQTNELEKCSTETIHNAYDNAIRYTDYFINETIELLKPFSETYEVTLIYVSDHGESLGENGVYLHGMPYAFAPEAQTHVPLLVWVSKGSDVEIDSVLENQHKVLSHDAITPTLIDVFELKTDEVKGQARLFRVSEEAHSNNQM